MEYVLDSFAWMEYFSGNSNYAKYIERDSANCFTSVTALTEVVRSLFRKKLSKNEIKKAIEFVNAKSVILYLDQEKAINAAFIAEELKLHFSDALIYSFATNGRLIVTGDKHFKNLEFVEFVS